ncbi:MAG: extracellular solute-binding protein [Flavobacteriales bacterium]
MKYAALLLVLFAFASCINEDVAESNNIVKNGASITLYSHRHYDSDKEIFTLFEKETGIKVNVKEADARELTNLIEKEGKQTQADVFITSDAVGLYIAETKGILDPFSSELVNTAVPQAYKHPNNLWVALTLRARVTVYNPNRVNPEEINFFSDLADKKWKGRIAVRSSDNFYNQSLLAGILARKGDEAALLWCKDIVANMFRSPQGNDRDQIKEVAAGNADIAIVNTYYYGKMLESNIQAEVDAVKKVKLHFTKVSEEGVHMNISGVGIVKESKNKEAATKFIEFLLRKDIQEKFANANFEYPVNKDAQWSPILKSWGEFTPETLNISELGSNNNKAIAIFARAGWK